MSHISPESSNSADASVRNVAVVGGGLAGMAAALAAAERGFRIELFERSKTLGGRAGSFVDPKIGEPVDFCQHVAMGCCSGFIDFCRQAGIDDCFRRTSTLHFIAPDGRRCDFTPSRWLPAPLHLLPGLVKLNYLTSAERWKIVRVLRKLVGWVEHSEPHQIGEQKMVGLATLDPPYNYQTVGDWLRRHGQSQRAIDRFWSPVLLGALAETVDHASLAAARKVFRDGFLASRDAGDLLLPRRPLVEIFNDRLGEKLVERGVKLHLNTTVRRIEGNGRSARSVVLDSGERIPFDRFVAAVPWRKVRSLLADELPAAIPSLANVDKIPQAAITTVHLWFDRPVVPLRHAVLVDRLGQWVFAKRQNGSNASQHCQVVISASHRIKGSELFYSRNELLNRVLDELRAAWPAVNHAKLLHSRVITNPAAVFSCVPGLDEYRPAQKTPIPNLSLAGDWTATGWPGTMESAIRSGELAVDALFGDL